MNSDNFKIDYDLYAENEQERIEFTYKDISFINKTMKDCGYSFTLSDNNHDIITITVNNLMYIEIFKTEEAYFLSVTTVLNATSGDNLDEFTNYKIDSLNTFLPDLIQSDDFQSFFFLNEDPDKIDQKILEGYIDVLIENDNVELLSKLSGLIRY